MASRVRAVVRVTLEVESDSVWSGDTTWEQIAKQAEDGVSGLLLGGNLLALKELQHRIKKLEIVEVRVTKEPK